MAIIEELERQPRGVYTGAIGLLSPNGDAVFNVPIRTLVVDARHGAATFGVGGGITWDSPAAGEYEECCLKTKFLIRSVGRIRSSRDHGAQGGRVCASGPAPLSRPRLGPVLWISLERRRVRRALDDARQSRRVGRWRVRLLIPGGMGRLASKRVLSVSSQVRRPL